MTKKDGRVFSKKEWKIDFLPTHYIDMKKENWWHDLYWLYVFFAIILWIALYFTYPWRIPQWPKILMLCSAPWQDCEPYIQPQPFTWYNNSWLSE